MRNSCVLSCFLKTVKGAAVRSGSVPEWFKYRPDFMLMVKSLVKWDWMIDNTFKISHRVGPWIKDAREW